MSNLGGWVNGGCRDAVYGGTEENKTFLSTGSGLAYAFLHTDVDAVENYSVELKNFHLSADNMDGGSSFLLSTRRPGVEIGWAYDFRPVGESDATADDKIWEDFGGDASNPAIAGADADPDGDGIRNLMKCALGLDPLAPSAGLLPMHGVVEHEGENYLTLTYTRPTDITGVSYTVEGSSDLTDWQGGPVEVNSSEENGQETILVRDAEPISQSSRRFLRLNVTVD